jgi:predicted SprT family Zn-dependent metalloprotease
MSDQNQGPEKAEARAQEAPRPDAGQAGRQPTQEQWDSLMQAFQYFNIQLFGAELKQPILNTSRHRGAHGFFRPRAYLHRDLEALPPEKVQEWLQADSDYLDGRQVRVGEISLNPDSMGRTVEEIFATLVHEMCHLWQDSHGSPGRRGYHNAEWVRKMLSVGLDPYEFRPKTGERTGKKTGESVSHDIVDGGLFRLAWQAMPEEYKLPWMSWVQQQAGKSGGGARKVRVACPGCRLSCWLKEQDHAEGKVVTCDDCGEHLLTKDELEERENDERDE